MLYKRTLSFANGNTIVAEVVQCSCEEPNGTEGDICVNCLRAIPGPGEPGWRYKCAKETPWTPDKGKYVTHVDARETGSCSNDCCAYYKCPNCGQEWKQELPE